MYPIPLQYLIAGESGRCSKDCRWKRYLQPKSFIALIATFNHSLTTNSYLSQPININKFLPLAAVAKKEKEEKAKAAKKSADEKAAAKAKKDAESKKGDAGEAKKAAEAKKEAEKKAAGEHVIEILINRVLTLC